MTAKCINNLAENILLLRNTATITTLHTELQQACRLISRMDAEILLAHVLALPRSSLHAYPERILTPSQHAQFQALLQRRVTHEPLAYLLGQKEFWSLTLDVTQDTLIPRPETELLVELILEKLPTSPQTIADLGTGSGAIALAIAKERPHWQITATDYYPATLAIAQRNARQLQLNHVRFITGDWCEALPKEERFDAIVSNPPYIAENDPHLAALSFEPACALTSGKDGFEALKTIITQAPNHLREGGWLLLEHGFDQAATVQQLMVALGYQEVITYHDLANLERVTVGKARITSKNIPRAVPPFIKGGLGGILGYG